MINNDYKSLAIITKRSILDVASYPDPPLILQFEVESYNDLHWVYPLANKVKYKLFSHVVKSGRHHRQLFSRVLTGPNFIFTPCVEITPPLSFNKSFM